MKKNYLIISTEEKGVLYAGEGSFTNWKQKLGTELDPHNKDYHLNQILFGPDDEGKSYLEIRMCFNPFRFVDGNINELDTAWVEVPLDSKVASIFQEITSKLK